MKRLLPLLLLLLFLLLLLGLYLRFLTAGEASRRGAALELAAAVLGQGDILRAQGEAAPTCVRVWRGHLVRLALAPWCPSPPGWPRRQPLSLGEVVEAYAAVDGRPYRLRLYRAELPRAPSGVGRVQLSGPPPKGVDVPAFLPLGAPWAFPQAPVWAVPCSMPRPDGCGAPPRYPVPPRPPLLPFYPGLGRPGEAEALARKAGVHLGEEAWVRLQGERLRVEGPGPARTLALPRNGVVYAHRLVVLGGRASRPVTLAGQEVALRGEAEGEGLGVLAEGSLALHGARVRGHLLARTGEVRGEGQVEGSLASFGAQAPGVRVRFRPGPPPPGWPRWPGGAAALPLEARPWGR